jgi:pyrrolysine biosynthesis protein PylD
LRPNDVKQIPRTLQRYDRELRSKTGSNLLEIAEDAAHATSKVRKTLGKKEATIVPITSGMGVIEGFSEAVAAILNHIGIDTVITRSADVAGFAEAYAQEADLILAADDYKFVAMNTRTGLVVDNATSTAKAYVTALDKMAKGIVAKKVLVIGVGTVGTAAISNLIQLNADPVAVDIDTRKLNQLKRTFGPRISVTESLLDALLETNLIVNSAPVRGIIRANMIQENTLISAPAIPVGLTEGARRKVGRNLIHDPLQLGVAAMAVEASAN